MTPIYLVVGVSGSGKSWACRQLAEKFHYIPHDACWSHPHFTPDINNPKWGPSGSVSTLVETLIEASRNSQKPIVTECPFSERKLREDLEKNGIKVVPIFIVESPETVSQRYWSREGRPIQKSALSRASTIINRALEWNSFNGTSSEVLEYLRNI